ncbi:Tim10/DDP family zinc finger-domain-containing protein [Dioszegia hungarica]|uniref:Mitochondrial import inner membrane translocase subunit n=1 Tax=Dioszegia hungarica TaxID=4972 RepID=A0AA38LTN8_9TREE|nr:Tim10/DDP family zinc finger-domain-containing protein [Dioszegia hungarica]KAI9634933.1 Tim10/DDP family zinc finger-domain-containing protein [Dioszegia hungarica]
MSYLFGGGAKQDTGAVDPVKMEMAVAELDMITDVFNRLVTSCHQKCIQPNPQSHRYAEGELLKGEAVCIDRCSAKFFEVNKVVGERMQAMGGTAQATGGFGGR